LGDYVKIRTGKLDANAAVEGGEFPFFTCAKGVSWIDTPAFDANAVLVAGNGDLNVKHYIGKFNAYQRTYVIENDAPDKLDMRYLFHFMDRYVETLRRQSIGGVIKYIKLGNLTDAPFPIKPIEEQRRIAAILDKADAIRRKRQQALTLADDFLRATFLDMFGDPVVNPKGWDVKKLGDVTETQLGKMLSAKAKQGVNPKPYLRNANIRWRHIETDDLLNMDFSSAEQKKFTLKNGDLLVCEGGEIGRCAIWRTQVDDCFYQKALHRLRVNANLLTPEYLQEYFFWMAKRGGLIKASSEVTFTHLTAEKIRTLPVPCPPINVQLEFVEQMRKIENFKKSLGRLVSIDTELFASLSQRAFRGDL
jgi:type I restriction enzyme S subunit